VTEKKNLCMVCAKPSETSICESCKTQIQGEAADKKQKMEKSVSVGSEVEKDRRVKHSGDRE